MEGVEKYLDEKKRQGQQITKSYAKQKGKDLETLCRGMIRHVMVKTNQDIISEQCIRNYHDDMLALQAKDRK